MSKKVVFTHFISPDTGNTMCKRSIEGWEDSTENPEEVTCPSCQFNMGTITEESLTTLTRLVEGLAGYSGTRRGGRFGCS